MIIESHDVGKYAKGTHQQNEKRVLKKFLFTSIQKRVFVVQPRKWLLLQDV